MNRGMLIFISVALVGWGYVAYAYSTSFGTKYATPTVVTVPLYGSLAAPPQAAQQGDVLHEILAEVQKLNASMERLIELAAGPVPQAQGQPGGGGRTHLDVLSQSCARCHNAADAEKKGAGFALTDAENRLLPLTPASAVKIFRMVGGGLMPPKGSGVLPDADKKLILEWVEE